MRTRAVLGTLVLVFSLVACGGESTETEQTTTETEQTTATGAADCPELVEIADCPNLDGANLDGRCAQAFPGSVSCLQGGGELCDGYPPVNAAFLGTIQCGDREVESWCCK